MKILYYDCFAGISGDMNLAAMIDAGVDPDVLIGELKKLPVAGYKIEIERSLKMGISGTNVHVLLDDEGFPHENHSHGHHSHDHHSHGAHPHEDDAHGHHSHGDHPHGDHENTHSHQRNFKDIKQLINESELKEEVKQTAIKIFEKVAIAEGKVHNKPPEEIHFHEVGAVDSIVDIVGAAICYHELKPDRVLASTVELGGGFVNCAHGKFPVPAPATAEIVKNIPVKTGGVNAETTTPTGAAILATLVDEFTDSAELSITKTAYGLGKKDFEIPNVLRVFIAEEKGNKYISAKATVLDCNIDDMNPEIYSYLFEELIQMGAQDIYLTPIQMKKGRPATKISILCSRGQEQKFRDFLLQETSTFGIREYPVQKSMLNREEKTFDSSLGKIRVKMGVLEDEIIKYKPEYENVKELAKIHNLSMNRVYQILIQELENLNLRK